MKTFHWGMMVVIASLTITIVYDAGNAAAR